MKASYADIVQKLHNKIQEEIPPPLRAARQKKQPCDIWRTWEWSVHKWEQEGAWPSSLSNHLQWGSRPWCEHRRLSALHSSRVKKRPTLITSSPAKVPRRTHEDEDPEIGQETSPVRRRPAKECVHQERSDLQGDARRQATKGRTKDPQSRFHRERQCQVDNTKREGDKHNKTSKPGDTQRENTDYLPRGNTGDLPRGDPPASRIDHTPNQHCT